MIYETQDSTGAGDLEPRKESVWKDPFLFPRRQLVQTGKGREESASLRRAAMLFTLGITTLLEFILASCNWLSS